MRTLSSLDGDGRADGLDLSNNVRIVLRQIVDAAKDLNGLLFAASLGQPAGAFRAEEDDACDGDGEKELDGNGRTPCRAAVDVREAVVLYLSAQTVGTGVEILLDSQSSTQEICQRLEQKIWG